MTDETNPQPPTQHIDLSQSTPLNPFNPATSGFAIVSLILSLLGFSILGVIFGHVAKSEIRKTGKQGRGMATAGLVIGYIGCAFWTLFIISVVAAADSSDDLSDFQPASVSRLDRLHNDCASGDMGACDDLFREAPWNSAEERFGDTCGNRQAADTYVWCE